MYAHLFAVGDPASSVYIRSILDGLKAVGYRVDQHNPSPWTPAEADNRVDLVVLVGLRPKQRLVMETYQKHNIPVLAIDSGFYGRPNYLQIGIGQLNWLPPFPCPPDRIAVETKKSENKDGPILLCSQHFADVTHGMGESKMKAWAAETYENLAAITTRKVIHRSHPQSVWTLDGAENQDPREVPFEEALAQASALVTFNSTSGIHAMVNGVPVFCDKSAMYSYIANTDIENIDQPKLPSAEELEDFLARMYYAQWTFEEIAKGEPFQFLRDTLAGKRPSLPPKPTPLPPPTVAETAPKPAPTPAKPAAVPAKTAKK